MSESAFTRLCVLLGLFAVALCGIFILQYTRFPYEPYRLFIFGYLLRIQDLPAVAVLGLIVLAAALPGLSRPGLMLVEAIGQRPWASAAITFVLLCMGQIVVAKNHALAGDEYLVLMQAKAFAAGHLTARFPPELVTWVVPWPYVNLWLFASVQTGKVVSVYWPGFALLLAPFVLLGIPWACNAALTSGSLVVIAALARRLIGSPAGAGWALLLAVASPAFTGMALGYFSMPAHLFLNLLFAWLLLERTPRRLLLAGAVGSLALILNNPMPHILFALPWIFWIAWREGRGALLRLAAGYAPLTLVGGLGWWLLMRDVQGHLWYAPYPGDAGLGHRFGNFLFHWQLQFDRVFVEPDTATLAHRIAEFAKLWLWTVPGLPALALIGWWRARQNVHLRLLGLSFAAMLAGYVFVRFDQGYGWGVRYLHPALGALPILGAAAMATLRNGALFRPLPRYIAAAALLSLAVATPLRAWQIHAFMEDQLSRRPAFEKGVPQAVFVTLKWDYYTQDFVQNDPFLRDPVVFLLSRGPAQDEALLRERFPSATLARVTPYGSVWRLGAPLAPRNDQLPAK